MQEGSLGVPEMEQFTIYDGKPVLLIYDLKFTIVG